MLSLLWFVALAHAATLLVGHEQEFTTIESALDASAPGDTLLLSDASFDVQRTLAIEHALTIECAPGIGAAVLRSSSDSVDVLVAINSNDVTLRNLVFAHSGDPRAIDVFVSSGTQAQQSSLFSSTAYGVGQHHQRRRSISSALLDAGGDDAVSIDQSTRGIRNLVLTNIDFSVSTSAINLAFDIGAYINVSVQRCVFAARTQALVTVPGARFAESDDIALNVFASIDSLSLKGTGLALGANYWSLGQPTGSITYCADRQCAMLGPVVDADRPQRAFITPASALDAGVRDVLVTADRVEFGTLNNAITQSGTTIRGRTFDACASGSAASVSVITLRESIVSSGAALVAMSDLRFTVTDAVATAVAYVDGTDHSDVLFERVTFVADTPTDQTILKLASKSMSLTLSRCTFIGGGHAVENSGGALVVTDSTFGGNQRASVFITGTGSGTGLRVSGSQFVASPHGSIVFDPKVLSSQMLPISVTCSRFVMAQFIEPSDCLRNAQQCANALRYNSFIEVQQPSALVANRRFLAHGSNHVEHVLPAQVADFAQLQHSDGTSFAFTFTDKQGRFGRVRADVAFKQRATHEFVLASNVPMRQECFAESVPGQRVVSGLFSVVSDAPERCTSVALQFTVVSDARDNSTVKANDGVSVYDVRHLGNSARGSVVWQKASSTQSTLNRGSSSESNFVVESSSGAGSLLQAVVVAQSLNANERAQALASGDAARVQSARQRFCVACDGETIPSYIIGERCDGGGPNRLFTDFDLAMSAASDAATKSGESVSLMVYGQRCATKQCHTQIGNAAFTLEGLSVTQQARLTRSSTCAANVPMLAITAPSITVRYLVLGADSLLSTAVPAAVISIGGEKSRVSFNTISGGVLVAANNAELTGNEIAAATGANAINVAEHTLNTLVQSNTIKQGTVRVELGAQHVAIDRNTLMADADVDSVGEVLLSGNTFADRSLVSDESTFCVRSSFAFSTFTSTDDGYGVNCRLVFDHAGRVRITGKKSTAWYNVRALFATTSGARIANVNLMGAQSQIVLDDVASNNVVLYDIGIDLEQSSVSDALIGQPLSRTPCSGTNEPQIGGFAVGESLVLDAKTRRVLLGGSVPRLKTSEFIDPFDGGIKSCVDTPTADFCKCMAASGTTARPRKGAATEPPQPALPQDPRDNLVPVQSFADEPLDENSLLDQVLPQTLARAAKKFLPKANGAKANFQVLAVNSHNGNNRDNASRTGWIIGGILLGLLVLVIIGVLVCCFCGGTTTSTRRVTVEEEDDGTEIVHETQTFANANRHQNNKGGQRKPSPTPSSGGSKLSMGVTADELNSVSSAGSGEKSKTIKHRKATSRMEEV